MRVVGTSSSELDVSLGNDDLLWLRTCNCGQLYPIDGIVVDRMQRQPCEFVTAPGSYGNHSCSEADNLAAEAMRTEL